MGCVCVCRPVYADVTQMAELLVANNFTYFFDINATGSSAKWFRSAVLFNKRNRVGVNVWEQGQAVPVPWDEVGAITHGALLSLYTRNC